MLAPPESASRFAFSHASRFGGWIASSFFAASKAFVASTNDSNSSATSLRSCAKESSAATSQQSQVTTHNSAEPPQWLADRMSDPQAGGEARALWDSVQQSKAEAAGSKEKRERIVTAWAVMVLVESLVVSVLWIREFSAAWEIVQARRLAGTLAIAALAPASLAVVGGWRMAHRRPAGSRL